MVFKALVEISGILRDTWHFALFRWRETRPLRAEKCLCSSRYALRAAALSVTPQKTKKTPKSVSFCFGGDNRSGSTCDAANKTLGQFVPKAGFGEAPQQAFSQAR